MGPLRKKPKPNPPYVAETNDQADENHMPTTSTTKPTTESLGNSTDAVNEDAPTPLKGVKDASAKQLKSKNSWYGTWPRKSMASTQVARETILADKPKNGAASSDLSRFEPKKPQSPSATPSATPKASRPPSMYLGKSKETLDVTMGDTLEDKGPSGKETKTDKSLSTAPDSMTKPTKTPEDIPPQSTAAPAAETTLPQRPITSSGWLGGWLSRSTPQEHIMTESPPKAPEASQPDPTTEEQKTPPSRTLSPPDNTISAANPTASWFGLWSTTAPSAVEAQETTETQLPVKTTGSEDTAIEEPLKPNGEPTVGSSWAFWSNDTSKKAVDASGETQDSGLLAVSGEPSQDNPVPAKIVAVKDTKKGKSSKRERPESTDIDERSRKLAQSGSAKEVLTPTKTSPPNLIIPSVKQTYRLVENPSILQQIARLLLHGHQPPAKHVFLAKDPPKIKKAVAIGIHGLFPSPLFRAIIGQPTGTSVRFMKHAEAAIRRWADAHGSTGCRIKEVALEAEGKIAERVDKLWKSLLNSIDDIRSADFIMVACHSQGVPVAVMLVAKLIEFGVVSSSRIGICAMAGVSLGPFVDHKGKSFGESTVELYDFADPESTISKRYEDSLRVALKYGVKIIYCGSIDDQLVSMESSTFSMASHPYIYRAVFVDGRIHAPNFISHLVGFALKLRNLGVSDHGLIRELSAPLAGSLYTGEGHSVLHGDERVYDLAVEFALETTTIGDVPLDLKKYEIPTNANPYVLPWIMRGLLEEDFVRTELSSETTELLKQFDDWKPATKVLKDVKYRLEAVRSKL